MIEDRDAGIPPEWPYLAASARLYQLASNAKRWHERPMSIFLAAAAGLCIASVHDGDTLRLCGGERVRLQGIDAPEVADSPRCAPEQRRRLSGSRNPSWCDFQTGKASKQALQTFLTSGRVSIERFGADNYGRTLANIYVNNQDAGEFLISRGLARRWR